MNQKNVELSILKSGIATRNSTHNQTLERLWQVCTLTNDPLVLCGPPGVGKGTLARNIHQLKHEKKQLAGRFISVHCATLREDAALSVFCGQSKDTQSGAGGPRAGHLKEAHGGILFLDNIGNLSLEQQALLLTVLEDKTFTPVGSDSQEESDFQLIASTTQDLKVLVNENRFRQDLYSRLCPWTFDLLSLKERSDDIEPNISYELDRCASRLGKKVTFNKEALGNYLRRAREPGASWTGNFRDLSNSISRLATLAHRQIITPLQVDQEWERLTQCWEAVPASHDAFLRQFLSDERIAGIDHFDRGQLVDVIRVCQRSKSLSDAGRELFQASREKKKSFNDSDRLKKYLAKFDLGFSDIS